jgi:UDP-N-acetylmuramate dehydrogenase
MKNFKLENQILHSKNYIPISKDETKKKKTLSNNYYKFTLITIFLLIFLISILIIIIKNINKDSGKLESYLPLSKKAGKQNKSNNEFIRNLKTILNEDEIFENEKMSKYTTFRIGGPAKYFVKPKTTEQIIHIMQLCNKYKIHFFILGNGSNLLVSDNGYYGVVIQIREDNFSKLKIIKKDENNYTLIVGGGMLMKTLSIQSCLLSLTGLEDIIDIPGTVGGGIIMNASFRGTGLKKPLTKVTVITQEGNIKKLTKEECKLEHRKSLLKDKKYIVVEAEFILKKGDKMKIQKTMTDNTKMRYEKQPMYFGSAGCFFIWDHNKYGSMYKKYKESYLVSYKVGDIMIYTFNISFIINLGQGTASEVMEIVNHIEKIMKEKYKIEIRREVIIIGLFNDIEYY